MPAISDRTLLLAVGGSALSAVAAVGAWIALSDTPPAELATLPVPSLVSAAAPPTEAPEVAAEIVVDVEGGVVTPGLHRLAGGSRIADAIEAAGGYGPDADLEATSLALNLAAPLTDGQQVRVPRTGEAATPAAPVPGMASEGVGAPAAGGPVNLNTASPEELDTLPGIGPVTVQKIVAARQQAPFASLDDAVARDVLNNGQLEKIRDLATV